MKKICKIAVSFICVVLLFGNSFALVLEESPFHDVNIDDWYYDSVYACRETGIFVGGNANLFHPNQKITIQESYTVLARLHQRYTNNHASFTAAEGDSWSDPYLRYCTEQQIMSVAETDSYTVLTRELFALFLSRIYDLTTFDKINDITDIVDYNISSDLGYSVLALYQAGIFCGTDSCGSFSPLTELSRAECAAIITRLIYLEKRVNIEKSACPLNMELNFLQGTNLIYDFDGKYVYLVDSSIDEQPVYYISDLYGRKIIESSNRIDRQTNGIFKVDDFDMDSTSYYNTEGNLIYHLSVRLNSSFAFLYGKLAVMQNDGSISVLDTQGREIEHIENMDEYWIVGSMFGDYIPVIPLGNRNYDNSYWLNIYTGVVKELPFKTASAHTAKGQEYMVVSTYNESAGRSLYNAIDTSLNIVFPQLMESMQVLKNGVLVAEDGATYYVLRPGEEMCSYPKEHYGKIKQFSLSDRILQHTVDGGTQISNLKTGEIYASFPDIDTYLIVGRKITRPRNVNGITVIDLFDEHGNLEQEGIRVENKWYGDMGQILYRVDNQYFYISG